MAMTYVAAALIGWILGLLANRFIYDWAWFPDHSLSPIGSKPAIYPRRWIHFLPLISWFCLGDLQGKTLYARELELASDEDKQLVPMLGTFSGFRPFLVELICIVGLPLLTWWYFSGGLVGGASNLRFLPQATETIWVQLFLHASMLWLMLIAAAIDWEERTIPDQVTVTGLVLAIVTLTVWPSARLPELGFSGISVTEISPVNFLSPGTYPEWGKSQLSFIVAILVWTFWALLVVPKSIDWRYGPSRTLRYMWASILRPKRKSAQAATRSRPKPVTTWVTLVVWIFGIGITIWAWSQHGETWESYFTQVVSLGLAGLGTWLIRILAGMTVGDEALGFGDVTLMFMIGAAFGWQFALLTFVMGPLLALGYAVVNLIATGEQKLAFGPWLCAGAAICLIFWGSVWNEYAANGIFKLGAGTILAVVAFCLALLPPLLWILLRLKRIAGLAQ